MSAAKRYVLDANVLIQAHRRYYAFDICPGFWLALVRQHEARRVCSIDPVKAELVAAHDALSDWVKDRAPATFFKGTTDRAVTDTFRDLVNWVQTQVRFTAEAKAQFASVADGWVVAYARANSCVVATLEEHAPDARRIVPIPNLCLEFNVDYCNTFEMLKELKVKFGLKKHK